MKNCFLLIVILLTMQFAKAQKEEPKKDTNAVVAPDLSPPILTEDEHGNQVILKSDEQSEGQEMNKNDKIPKRTETIRRQGQALKVPVRKKKK